MLIISLLLTTALCVNYKGYKKILVEFGDVEPSLVNDILVPHESVEIWSKDPNSLTFSISPTDYQNIAPILSALGLLFEVIDNDVQRLINDDLEKRDERRGESPSVYAYDEYLDYDEYKAWVEHVAEDHGGLNVSVQVVGHTLEGREIPGLIIPGTREETLGNPGIAIDCGIHAREWISPAMCRLFVHELIKCTEAKNADECNPIVRDQFYDYNWFIIPMMNPDGYQYTWTDDRLWRKNRSPSQNGLCIGTDLNRNSPVAWGTEGASDNPCSSTYRGDGESSEKEIQTMQEAFAFIEATYTGPVKAYVSLHSYSQKIISSYAVSRNVFPDDPESIDAMQESGRRISEAMTAVHGTKYEYGQARDILYPSSGSTKDWVLKEKNVPLDWTWELR